MTFRNGFSPGAGTRFIPIIAWVVLMLIPVPIRAAEFAAIVYGSFTSEIRAQDHLQAIQVKVSDELSMHNVLINGIPYYRILGTASETSSSSANALMRRVG